MYKNRKERKQKCRVIRLKIVLLILVVVLIPVAAVGDSKKLPFQFEHQQGNDWCACACVNVIINRYREDYPEWPTDTDTEACDAGGQCAIMNRLYDTDTTDCCDSDDPCTNQGQCGTQLVDVLAEWRVDATRVWGYELDYSEYVSEINANKPVVIHVVCYGSGHNVLGVGYDYYLIQGMYIMNPTDSFATGGHKFVNYADVVSGAAFPSSNCTDTDTTDTDTTNDDYRPWYSSVKMDYAPTEETVRLRCSENPETYSYELNGWGEAYLEAGDDVGRRFWVTGGTTRFKAPHIRLKKGFKTANANTGVYFKAELID